MANEKYRVPIPKGAEKLLKLASAVYKKHIADGTSSPLNSMSDYKWETEGPKLALAQAKQEEAERLMKEVEKVYKERDLLLSNIPATLRASKSILLGINSQNPKRLGDWGFIVDSTPITEKEETKKSE
ncbi:MAG TPA: hypothetical protein VHO90_06100 [Bacteroidales bacterium]|nr:hypothetical protein [Bacteroidales bacterium]